MTGQRQTLALARTPSGPRSIRRLIASVRGLALTALLIMAAALISAMVIEAWRSDLRHRATALKILHDQAAAAAWNFRLALVARVDSTRTNGGRLGAPLFDGVMRGNSLLPPSLVGNVANDSVLSVNITAAATGDTIYRSPGRYPSTYSATDSFPLVASGLLIEVSLRPDLAGQLVIGGLPHSRLPRLLSLLGLTLILLAIATNQVRREQELAAVRADFVASISHELRTPLTQILLFAETLRLGRARSRAERAFAVRVIHQEARRLIHLVENILTFTARQRRPAPPMRERVALGPFVRDVVASFAPLAAARQVRFRTDLVQPLVVQADPAALRQILLNLLENAVKFGPVAQEVTIGCRRAPGGVLLWVEDQGPGVALEHHEAIWKPFIRVQHDANQAPGSGLGLAVVRGLAEAHGGRAWIEAPGGGGARFLVLLLDPRQERATFPVAMFAARFGRHGVADQGGAEQ
jgi:signal transduction histidine kinase